MSEDNEYIFRNAGLSAMSVEVATTEAGKPTSGMDEHIERLMTSWDKTDGAAQGIATSLPHQMTAAAERLETARLAMRDALQAFVIAYARSANPETPAKPKSPLPKFHLDDIAYVTPDPNSPGRLIGHGFEAPGSVTLQTDFPLEALSADVNDENVLRLHYRNPVTDQDREWLLCAMNDACRHDAFKPLLDASEILAPHRFQIGGIDYVPLNIAMNKLAELMSASQPSHAMAVAGARSIGNTAGDENHMVRARACWNAMVDARFGATEPPPIGDQSSSKSKTKKKAANKS
jgi:hypothetical protein